ncbi:MAG: hypothetical protein JNL97_07645, partial [Verrucomicrobiales bacterium]|nr:hypothetical protein [Verrucomicrobiales bacterium]
GSAEWATGPLFETDAYWVRIGDVAGAMDSTTLRIEVVRRPQRISLSPPEGLVFGDPAVPVAASSDSDLPVSIAVVRGPGTMVGAGRFLATGAGEVVVRANQEGDARFEGAEPVEATFTVAARPVDIRWLELRQTADGRPKTVGVATTPAGVSVRVEYVGLSGPPVEPGDYRVIAVVDAEHHTGRSEAVLHILPPEPVVPSGVRAMQSWLESSGVPAEARGPRDDPDADGLPNLMEFAMGTSPLHPKPGEAPKLGFRRAGGAVVVEYEVRRFATAVAAGVGLVLEVSPDLSRWTAVEPKVTVLGTENGVDRIRLEDPTPWQGAAPRFSRLRVVER